MKEQHFVNIEKTSTALISVIAAIFLTSTKLIVGLLTGSLGIISEALHSGLDLVAACITYLTVRISDRPPDTDHNYGHGKIENLSSLFQVLILLLTSLWIIFEAISRLLGNTTHIQVNQWSFIVVITSIVIDFWRSRVLLNTAKKYNSQALEADALHFSTDIWSSVVVLFGLICAKLDLLWADAVAALFVALLIIWISAKLGKKSIDALIDKSPTEPYLLIEDILKNEKKIISFRNLRVRYSGADTFVDVIININPFLNVREAHRITDEIEEKISIQLKRCSINIHPEPDTNILLAANS